MIEDIKGEFHELLPEIRIAIYSLLAPQELTKQDINLVPTESRAVWEKKFKIHFSVLYDKFLSENEKASEEIDWKNEFKRVDDLQYIQLMPHQRHLFHLLREERIDNKELEKALQENGNLLIDILLNPIKDRNNITLLDCAVEQKVQKAKDFFYQTISQYCEKMAVTNFQDNSSLHLAAYLGQPIIHIESLIAKNKENLNKKNKNGQTPLYLACLSGYTEIVEYLIKKGANINEKDKFENTILYMACERGCTPAIIEVLLKAGANIDGSKHTLLHAACASGRVEVVEFWLNQGAELDTKCNEGFTPLQLACEKGYTAIVKLLLQKGADIRVKDKRGNTCLHVACKRGHTDIVRALLEESADVHAKDEQGDTPLQLACEKDYIAIVKLLLQKGADVHAKDEQGFTPLQLACEKGYTAIVKLLLQKGADIRVKDNRGHTCLHVACKRGHTDIVRALLEESADVHAKDEQGGTPLHFACRKGHKDIVKYLLQKGADIHINDECDNTPLHVAGINKQAEIIQYLIKKGAHPEIKNFKHQTSFFTLTERLLRVNLLKNIVNQHQHRKEIADKIIAASFEETHPMPSYAVARLFKQYSSVSGFEEPGYKNIAQSLTEKFLKPENAQKYNTYTQCAVEIKKIMKQNPEQAASNFDKYGTFYNLYKYVKDSAKKENLDSKNFKI